ncbi:Lipopolysaccharide synthesis sugar transferase [Ignavibacterium album JCM 16511]|uniref:Lipopolysaccharide synthesis sugar transferase n=1 Tax=Ignavibacterium album (strain DSM 19864 / JCM 16511 / NBRC 101810 / Mat9-16) TaxID=945713 RepID=I0AP62_IGNAJ|nr:undecaprenyl-phosphate glucose phosphotransferase [Ignavibacterium album]AFH50769.1 Lipopolysaccharide synthesis sugar transferase [Ignavibacterium album JCM 16511]
MIVNKRTINIARLLSDLILLNLVFILSAVLAQSLEILLQRNYMFILLALLNLVWYFYTNLSGFYNDFFTRRFSTQFFNIVKSSVVQVLITIAFIFFVKEDLFTRNFIVYLGVFLTIAISVRTIIFKKSLKELHKKGISVRNLIIIGTGETGKNFKETICDVPEFGYRFIGFVDDEKSEENYLGKISELDKILKSFQVDDVVITLPEEETSQLDEIIRVCNINAVKVHLIPDYFRFLSNRFQVSSIGSFPVITARDEPLEEASRRFLKRSFDIFFSLFVIVFIFSWLFPLIALLIKLNSKGSVFYLQERVGVRDQKFKCYKFRTMKTGMQKIEFNPVTENDPRVTPIGKFLRKSNIDELPQFFNVLKGEMSVVGPRPHPIPFHNKYSEYFEAIKLRHNVKPGITGWAQVHGFRGDVPNEEENRKRTLQRIKYDLWYIENWSFKLDLQIIMMTLWQMITGKTNAV